MTHSENENDHFDLDHLDHILTMCPAVNGLKSQPVEYQDQLLYVRSTSVSSPLQVRSKSVVNPISLPSLKGR